MFKPNRIGTPWLHTANGNTSIANTALAQQAITASSWEMNIINATPQGDFGQDSFNWAPATPQTIATNSKGGIGQQFTINPVINGDTVGLEIMGNIILPLPADAMLVPYLTRMNQAATSVMQIRSSANIPSGHSKYYDVPNTGTGAALRSLTYRTQFLASGQGNFLAGTWSHGFLIYTVSLATISFMEAEFSIRQLNDQQNIGYRDTRR